MTRRILDRFTSAHVIAVIALVFAIGGAAAYAGFRLPNNVVKSKNIRDGQVKTQDVANNNLTGTDIKEASLTGDGQAINFAESGPTPSTKLFTLGPWTVSASCTDLAPNEVTALTVKGPASTGSSTVIQSLNGAATTTGFNSTAISDNVETPILSVTGNAGNASKQGLRLFLRSNSTIAEFDVNAIADATLNHRCDLTGIATLGT